MNNIITIKKYDKYKDSGIEWIGEIPQNWDRTKLKRLLSIPITDGPHETPELLDDGIPFLSAEAIKNNKLNFDLKRGYISPEEHRRFCRKCKPQLNDIFMIKSGATTGNVAIVETEEDFSIWSPLALIRVNKNILNYKYLFYYLQSYIFQKQVELFWSYGTQQNIGMEVLGNLYIAFTTTPDEQQQIADYLDKKCGEIDKVVETEKAVIERLKEYKQSVITEAVTKGLDKSVPLKDSGIEWIGKIPEHWEIQRLKQLISKPLQYGANESGDVYNEHCPRYIRITDINIEDNSLKEEGKLSLSIEKAKDYILENNDILFARSGATVGKTFLYKSEYGLSAFAGYLIRARMNKKVKAQYLYYYTLSKVYEEWKNRIFIQATIQNIGANKYNNLEISLPLLEEQKKIIDYLDKKCSEIDKVITGKEQLIEKLTEYKKSLIYECVTGKRKVAE